MVRPGVWLVALVALGACTPPAEPSPASPGSGGKADGLGDECPVFEAPIRTGDIDNELAFELSGAVASRRFPGVLWAHNDGGETRVVLAVDRRGRHLAQFDVEQDAIDWEDMSMGPGPLAGRDYLHVADIGDNFLTRDSISIVRFEEPDPLQASESAQAETFDLFYPDGPHDAESIFVEPRSGELYVITKRSRNDDKTLVFRTDGVLDARRPTLVLVTTEDEAPELDARVVGADLSADGSRLMLAQVEGPNLLWRRQGTIAATLGRGACRAPRPDGQHESVALSADGTAYYMIPEGEHPDIAFSTERLACPAFAPPEEVGMVADNDARGISGLAYSRRIPGRLWMVGGEDAVLWAVDSAGAVVRALSVPQAEAVDWEDLAVGPGPRPGRDYLYIADIGDNARERERIQIYRVLEPMTPGGAAVEVETFELEYEDGAHDAEALIVDPVTGNILIITRSRSGDRDTSVYWTEALGAQGSVSVLRKTVPSRLVEHLGTVEAADISSSGDRIIVRSRQGELGLWLRHPLASVGEALANQGCPLPGSSGNHDAAAVSPDGAAYTLVPSGTAPALIEGVAH